jgi:hypothetical protein
MVSHDSFPLSGLEMEVDDSPEQDPRIGKRILGAIATYFTAYGEAIIESKAVPTVGSPQISPEFFREANSL